MTTDKMFLRDMNTTVQDMNRMTRRHIVASICGAMNGAVQRHLRCMALMLLLLVGGMVNEAWGVTYTYHVVNNSGTIAISYNVDHDTNSDGLEIPEALRSPLITYETGAYSYYKELACSTPISTYDAVDTGNEIFVRYDYANHKSTSYGDIDLSGATSYRILTSAGYYLMRRISDNIYTGALNTLNDSYSDYYLWQFKGNDPYNIEVYNVSKAQAVTCGTVNDWAKDMDFSSSVNRFILFRGQTDGGTDDGYWYLASPKINSGSQAVYAQRYAYYMGNRHDGDHNIIRMHANDKKYFSGAQNGGTRYQSDRNNCKLSFSAVRTFTFHVTTPLTHTELTSELTPSSNSVAVSIPDDLKRKFVTYQPYYLDGSTKHYLTADGSDTFTETYQTLVDAGTTDIYIEYTSTLPFNTCTGFADADANNKWYNMQFSGSQYVYNQQLSGWNAFRRDGSQGIADINLFAFIGDPYEMRFINKLAGGNYYIGFPAGSGNNTNAFYSSAINSTGICTWELIDGSGYTTNQFALRQFNTVSSPKYIGINGNVLRYSSDSYSAAVISPPTSYKLTYQIIDASTGTTLATTTKLYTSGATATVAIPDDYRRGFCTYTYYTNYSSGTFSDEAAVSYTMNADRTIYVKCEIESGIFTNENDLGTPANINWKHVKGSYTNPYLKTDNGTTLTQAANVPSDVVDVDAYTFALVGNPYDFRLVSKKAGDYTAMDVRPAAYADGSTISVTTTDASLSHWEAAPAKGTGTFAFALKGTWRYKSGSSFGAFLRANNNTRQLVTGISNGEQKSNQIADFDFTLESYQPRFSATYKVFRSAGDQVDEAESLLLAGNAPSLPESAQRYGIASYTYHRGSIDGEVISTLESTDDIIYVTYTVDTTPFQFSTDFETATWYNMRFVTHTTTKTDALTDGHWWIAQFDKGGTGFEGQLWPGNGGNGTSDKAITTLSDPRAYYAFIGDPYSFEVVSMYAGNNLTVQMDGDYLKAKGSDDGRSWALCAPHTSSDTHAFRIVYADTWHNTTKTYWRVNGDRMGIHAANSANDDLLVQAVSTTYYPLTFRVYDSTNSFVVEDTKFYASGTTGLSVTLPQTIKRAYCEYKYYGTQADMTDNESEIAEETTIPSITAAATYYVKYTLTEKGQQIFSSNISSPLWFHLKNHYSKSSYYVTSNASGTLGNLTTTFDTSDATAYDWCFIGTPYGFKIYNRKAGKYMKPATATSTNNGSITVTAEATDDLTTWEAYHPYSSGNECSIILEGTWKNFYAADYTSVRAHNPSYFYPYDKRLAIENINTNQYFDFSTEVPNSYTYHIVDNSGRIAISYTLKSSEQQFPGLSLGHSAIPGAIYSPYIADETLTFYSTATQRTDGGTPVTDADGRAVYNLSAAITTTPATNNANIYVRYTNTALSEKPLHLRGVRGFDIKVSGDHYLYDNGALTHDASTTNLNDRHHLWYFKGLDPYAVEVQNVGGEKYLLHSESPSAALNYGTSATGRYFILMQYDDYEDSPTNSTPRIELMAATGADLGGTTPANYYSVGAASGTPSLYANATGYEHGDATLKLVLTVGDVTVVYDIVDKQGKIVVANIANESATTPSLPAAWQSPLVSTYHYWNSSNFNIDGDTYTLKTNQTEIEGIAEAADGHVYVTYDVITDTENANYIDLNTGTDYTYRQARSGSDATQVRRSTDWGTMYRLEFTSSAAYHLENGSDREDTNETASGTHLYPYTNGDGPLYIYQESRWNTQKDAAASTRTRWTWFLLSQTGDPYRVMITSWQNSHANSGTNYYNFLRTYYNSELGAVVTGNVTDDPRTQEGGSQIMPTEYMILNGNGTTGDYLLKTSELVNGDHQTVNSFEQYWRNNPTVQRKLGMADASGEPTDEQKATLRPTWHSYNAYVNAAPWAGGSKSYAKGEHWFMTVEMGDGSFNLVSTEMDAALVLIDQHGWEVMRRTIYKSASQADLYAASKTELKKFDSPMVAAYHYYTNASKQPGYHKYTVSASNLQATTNSLGADYPQSYQGGMIRDLYVTYDVKPEYADGYDAATATATAYLVKQSTQYAKDDGTAIIAKETISDVTTVSDNAMLWYVQRNVDIDEEMAYVYNDAVNETKSKAETEAAYLADGKNGFDPYNLQIKNKNTGKYFKSNLSGATLSGGSWTGTYSGSKTVTLGSTLDAVSGEGNDNTTLTMTNTTFMAIDDGNGNIRLMPRFDHSVVQTDFGTLEAQQNAAPAEDDGSSSTQTTLLRLTNNYVYIIIDNQGRESLRFTSVGEVGPTMKSQFTSPFATNFTFYRAATESGGTYTLADNDLIATFAGVTLTDNRVYVRYDYDNAADDYNLLNGLWATMKVNDTYVQLDGTVKSGTKDATLPAWQWRLTQSSSNAPDPYAVSLYNNSDALAAAVSIGGESRFALLPYNDVADAYALAVAGSGSSSAYTFIDGSSLASGATITEQTDFAATGTIGATKKVEFMREIIPAKITYKLITNSGRVVLTDQVTPVSPYTPELPEWMRTPIMKSDAYHFFTSATHTGSDEKAGYTVNTATETNTMLSVDDLTDGILYVRYDYETSKQATTLNNLHSSGERAPAANKTLAKAVTLDLSGKVPYYLINTQGAWYWYRNNGGNILVTQDQKSGNTLYATNDANMVWYLTGGDPYEFKITNCVGGSDKFFSVQDLSSEAKGATAMGNIATEGDVTLTLNTFMLLKASNQDYLSIFVSGNEYLSLQENNNYIRVTKDDTRYSTHFKTPEAIFTNYSNTECFSFYPSLIYHVITNEGKEAVYAAATYHDTSMQMPDAIKSPLLNDEDFTFYTERPVWDSGTQTLTVNSGSSVAEGTAMKTLVEKRTADIYIRYTYNRDTSPMQFLDGVDKTTTHGLDLSGSTWYNPATFESNQSTIVATYTRLLRLTHLNDNDNNVYYAKYVNGDFVDTNYKTVFGSLSHKKLLWRLEGNDPYAIRIRNAYKGLDQYLSAGYVSSGNIDFTFTDDSAPEAHSSTFMYLNIHSNSDVRTGATLIPTGNMYENYTLNNTSGENIKLYNWGDLARRLGNSGVGSGTSWNSWVYFYKAPVTRKYHYHAYNQTTGKWTWDAVLEHDWLMPVVLEDQIARLYSKYETKSSTFTGDNSEYVTGTNTFQTRAELADAAQFYSDAAMTERIDAGAYGYDIYPEISTDEVYDIYFKYQADTEAEVGGLKLGDITSTAAEIAADKAYYAANGRLDEEHLENDTHANWYFMVLDTDYDVTATGNVGSRTRTGSQYFLRREDNGNVGWMNNSYALHHDSQDNYNQWSYHRLAEWYKQGDNDAFREGRWLWTFVGDDPYNMRIVNMETVVGVTPEGEGVYKLAAANNCYATVGEQAKTTTTGGVETTTYSWPVSIPTSEPSENDTWGLCQSVAADGTLNLLTTAFKQQIDNIDVNRLLYWQMQSKTANGVRTDSVAAATRTSGREQAIRLLPYVPVKYEDVKFVIRRDDEVQKYKNGVVALDAMTTGISKLYFAASERMFAADDVIDMSDPETLPLDVRRAFCNYTLYRDVFQTVGGSYTVKAGPYPTTTQATKNGSWNDTEPYTYTQSGDLLYDDDGCPIWAYLNADGTPAPDGAQSIYGSYEVTSDIFLRQRPTKAQVEQMKANNDHVYFMDFPDPKMLNGQLEAYNTGHHAYFDETATFQPQVGTLHDNETEKTKWDGSEFVNDTEQVYNKCQYKTTANRMETVPENLKWYFVGDPYHVQVYNTNSEFETNYPSCTNAANLARFDPTETRFQFVVDCVHLRIPDLSFIDERASVSFYDEAGNELGTVANANYHKPYYDNFYWEMVPSATNVQDGFALRFRADNQLMGYRHVCYYLSHDGLTREYRQADESRKGSYNINLNYRTNNARQLSGTYRGYHEANNDTTVIRLVQPAKVYFSAYKDAAGNHSTFSDGNLVTKEELSEYFGVGETITEVPRHLQRKYVNYCKLGYQKNNSETWYDAAFPVTLSSSKDVNAYNMETCSTHTVADDKVFVDGALTRASYKFRVLYDVDDITNPTETDPAKQIHLFSSSIDSPQWLDVMVGDGRWPYYDKTNVDGSGTENKTSLVSNYRRAMSSGKTGWNNDANGWEDGLKGLHWAFIGDPYDFTIVNRRRYEDASEGWLTMTKTTVKSYDNVTDSVVWTTGLAASTTATNTSTATAAADNTSHFSLQMWKVGGANDYFLRTASLKDASPDNGAGGLVGDYSNDQTDPGINQTNNYWRLISCAYKPDAASDYTSYFMMVPYSLGSYSTYVGNTYAPNYSKTMTGFGVTEQRLTIRTAVAQDDDGADNDCFDADVRVYSDGHILRLNTDKMEIKYGDAIENMPTSLKRYGCDYTCWYVTDTDSILVTNTDADTNLKVGVANTSFRELISSGTPYHLSYVYTVQDDVSPFFTTASDAQTDDYTWLNTYFRWMQTYSGTNVEVEYYESVFDHYVYSADGHIIDEVYREEKRTKVVTNPSEAYETKGYVNTHTGQTAVYGDEGTQSEDNRQKWALTGDPYAFTMKNYAQYLTNSNAAVVMSENDVVTQDYGSGQLFTICIDKKGNTYLAVVDPATGNILDCVDFEYGSTSDKSLYSVTATGINTYDPTGNTLVTTYTRNGKAADVKPFLLANLIRYADILIYHLVMAHQHSLDYADNLTTDQLTGVSSNDTPTGVNSRLVEFLRYWEKRNNKSAGTYISTTATATSSGYQQGIADETYVKTLLKQKGTLRNFLSYPVADQEVSRIGIGNRPQVPWYMKRQFCNYYMYQRDVQRSVTLDGKNGTTLTYAYLRNSNGDYVDRDGNVVDEEHRIQLFMADGSPAYEIMWVSVLDQNYWDDWTADDESNAASDAVLADRKVNVGTEQDPVYKKAPKYYKQAQSLQGAILEKLEDCHYNRKVLIDVVYEVNPDRFRFADRGRNTTAWYTMMTNNENDGLMNFSYLNGIGARLDRTHHYTNNYLWAPEGDPYGFVLRSRYATINGTGWDDVAVTTKGRLPKGMDSSGQLVYIDGSGTSTNYTSEFETTELTADNITATYTGSANAESAIPFNNRRIIHRRSGQDGATTDGATNAVYEMFVGSDTQSFLMHPTSAWMDNDDADHESYYMKHFTATNTTTLTKTNSRTLLADRDANWKLVCTSEQLIPYFDRSGYVGGLEPLVANEFANQNYRAQLRQSITDGTELSFSTLTKIQELVYGGTFKDNTGTTVEEGSPRPASSLLPMTFTSTNLVNMKPGYYRIKAFSEDALNTDGKDLAGDGSNIKGIIGPRYISGYRFESEKTDPNDDKNNGGRWLHFLETDMASSTIHTYADLLTRISEVDARKEGGTSDRDQISHPAMRGNIEILPADFDPSSIFQFTKATSATSNYEVYRLGTQGLKLWARPGGTEGLAEAHHFGRTELVESTPSAAEGYGTAGINWSQDFRLADIGGTAVTLRTLKQETGNWDADVAVNLKTNYVCIDRNHRYRITCHTDNEMVEIGDHYTTDGFNGIQDTKWLLQPVGLREDWPYNQKPLRVEVQKGGVNARDDTKADNTYYGSLYVPFDTRLGRTTDAAFTMTTNPTNGSTVTMAAVSQINTMGNSQYVPNSWPVIIHTDKPGTIELKNQDNTTYATRHYVDMFLPFDEPQGVTSTAINANLKGSYLERTLTLEDVGATSSLDEKTVMVFGLPFDTHNVGHDDNVAAHHEYKTSESVGWYCNDNWWREKYPEYKAHAANYSAAGVSPGDVATDAQRNNKYVYHNKAYFVYNQAYNATTPSGGRPFIVALFIDDEEPDDPDIDDDVTGSDVPWPCDVYDLQGRRVAENETPATLRRNHPALPRGVYVFGGRKVVVK